jgi:hypothetical protein
MKKVNIKSIEAKISLTIAFAFLFLIILLSILSPFIYLYSQYSMGFWAELYKEFDLGRVSFIPGGEIVVIFYLLIVGFYYIKLYPITFFFLFLIYFIIIYFIVYNMFFKVRNKK